MKAIIYRITLLEPTIVTALDGDPNSSVSFDYLPGSTLRGMLIGQYIREKGAFDAAEPAIRSLFFSNSTRFLNGYLVENQTNQRSLPAPLTWSRPKTSDYPITDSLSVSSDKKSKLKDDQEAKSVRDFWAVANDFGYKAKARRVVNVHHERNRVSGRPLGDGQGTVYRYDALAKDQTFEAVILCEHAADILRLLKNSIYTRLGGAHSAGYGQVIIHDIKENTEWHEADVRPQQDRYIITLLSDAILRDASGNYQPTLESLHIALSSAGAKIINAAVGTTIHGGFNRKWGMPFPQVPALKMGSVVELSSENVNEQNLLKIVQAGIGERRNEGFGRLAFNWQPFEILNAPANDDDLRDEKISTEPIVLSEESQKLWQRLSDRIIEQQINIDFQRLAYKKRYTIAGAISRTQLNRLRAVIADEMRKSSPSLEGIARFLNEIKGKTADKQFEQAKIIGDKSLKEWLLTPTFKEVGDLNDDPRITLQLMDSVLERAAKQAGENQHDR